MRAVGQGDGLEEFAGAHLLAGQQIAHQAHRPAGHVELSQRVEDLGAGALVQPGSKELVQLLVVHEPVVRGPAELVRPRRVADGGDEAFPHVLLRGEHLGPAVLALDQAEHGDLAQRARVQVAVIGPLNDVLAAERHRRLLPGEIDHGRLALGLGPAGQPAEHPDRGSGPRVELGDARGDAQRRPVRVALVADAAVEEVGLAAGVVRRQMRRRPLGVRAEAPEGSDRDGQPAAPAARQRIEVDADLLPVRAAMRVDQHVAVGDQPPQRLQPLVARVVEGDAALARTGVGEQRRAVAARRGVALAAQLAAAGRFDLRDGRTEVAEQSGRVGRGRALAVLEHSQAVEQRGSGDKRVAGLAVARRTHRSTPAASSASISSSLMSSSSRSTSALCWPSIGAGSRT